MVPEPKQPPTARPPPASKLHSKEAAQRFYYDAVTKHLEMEKFNQRVYYEKVKAQKEKAVALEAKYLATAKPQKLKDAKEVDELVQRVYYQSKERKREKDNQVKEKALKEEQTRRGKKLQDAQQMAENIQRVYTSAVDRQKERLSMLQDKYVVSEATPIVLTKEQEQESIRRLVYEDVWRAEAQHRFLERKYGLRRTAKDDTELVPALPPRSGSPQKPATARDRLASPDSKYSKEA